MTKRRRRRQSQRPIEAACLAAAVAALLLAACSTPQERHRVLSFFFDGVPDPDAPAPVAEAAAEDGGPSASGEAARGSLHEPFAERQCKACHDTTRRLAAAGDAMRGEGAWAACRRCHADPAVVGEDAHIVREGEWLHGPVALGACAACHVGHKSGFPYLLRFERTEGACRGCHEGVDRRSGSMFTLDCITCHDPHAAVRSGDLLLRGGLLGACARCHVLDETARPWVHGPVAVQACGICHDSHGGDGSSRHVRRPLAPICHGCHDPDPEAPGSCDRTRECDTCHDPHAAERASDLFLREHMRRDPGRDSPFTPPLARSETSIVPPAVPERD